MDNCGDNRFEIIERAKRDLIESTNITSRNEEMEVLDNFLFRCWQMGWLDKYEEENKEMSEYDREFWGESISQTLSRVDKIQFIAKKYGYNAQSRQLIEEMAELTQAINKFWRKDLKCKDELPLLLEDDDCFRHIAEEMADVTICLGQIQYLLDNSILVGEFIDEKLDRQIKRIKESEVQNGENVR